VKSLNTFLRCILEDLGMWCRTSTSHDLKKVVARVEHEGYSFLTITLANFGKDFERSLDQGFVGPTLFSGFQRKGGLPLFLGGFLDQVFNRSTGELLDEPSIACIHAIRQFTLMFAKISLPCTDAREKAAMRRYVECEQEIAESAREIQPEMVGSFSRISTLLWSDVFCGVDYDIHAGRIRPRHGPGATADGLRGNAKWRQSEWTERLEQVFPHGEYLASSWRYFQDLEHVQLLEPGAERPARVISVPKTLKTPRIIAIEPTCMQYVQQGLLVSIQSRIDRDNVASRLVGWASQVPNQHLACQGSRNGTLASLDLKEASDRVSNEHVRVLLRNHRLLAEAVDSTRTRKARVLGHGLIDLVKFASMGSALCFPFEAMVFATIIFAAIEEDLARPITRKDIKSYLGKVRVYGDDIIVPVDHVESTIRWLTAFGLIVNTGKSYWTGKFRESCGGDYYDGNDISIVRMRSVLPDRAEQSRRDYASSVVSTVSFRNQLYKAGLWKTVSYLDSYIEGEIPFPYVSEVSPVLGRHSFLGIEPEARMCPDLHVPLVKGMRVKATIPRSRLEGYAALNKCLSIMDSRNADLLESVIFADSEERMQYGVGIDLPSQSDTEHLEYAGRPVAVDIKHRWGPA